MEIDTSKTVIFREDRAALVLFGVLFVFLGGMMTYLSVVLFSASMNSLEESSGTRLFFWILTAVVCLTALFCYWAVFHFFHRSFWAHNKSLKVSPSGIVYDRLFKAEIDWGQIKTIILAKNPRGPDQLVFELNELPDEENPSRSRRWLRQFFTGTQDKQYGLVPAHFVEKDFPVTEVIRAYAKQYGDEDSFGKETDKTFPGLPFGFKWFWKSSSVQKWQKSLVKWSIGFLVALIALSLPAFFFNSSNTFVGVDYWQDFQLIFSLLVIFSFFFAMYLLTFLRFPLFVFILVSPMIGILVAVWVGLPLMYMVPLTLDQLSTHRTPATREFRVLVPRASVKSCPHHAIKIESKAPDKDYVCAPNGIRLRARKGDRILLIGEKSYWAFRYDNVQLIRE